MLPAEGVRTSAGPPVKPRQAKLGQHYTDIMAIMAKTKPKRLTLRLDHYPRPFIHSETLAILIKHQTMSIKLWVYRHINYIYQLYINYISSTIYQLYQVSNKTSNNFKQPAVWSFPLPHLLSRLRHRTLRRSTCHLRRHWARLRLCATQWGSSHSHSFPWPIIPLVISIYRDH